MADIPGLLGRFAQLPSVITQGLLGPLPQSNLGLDPKQMEQARQAALTDMAYGMLAGSTAPGWRNQMGTVAVARQNAIGNYQQRVFDIFKEQEIARSLEERQKKEANNAALIATLPEAARPLAEVAGAPAVAQLQLARLFAPPEKEGEPPAAIKIAKFLTDPETPEDQKAIVRKQIEPQRQGPGPTEIEREAYLRYPNDPTKRRDYIEQRLDKALAGPRVSAEETVKQKVLAGGVASLSPGEKEVWDRINKSNVPWWMSSVNPSAAQPGGAVSFDSLPGN